MGVTVSDVHRELGELPDHAVVAIIELEPTRAELVEARARLDDDVESLDRREPSERVARIVRVVEALTPEEVE